MNGIEIPGNVPAILKFVESSSDDRNLRNIRILYIGIGKLLHICDLLLCSSVNDYFHSTGFFVSKENFSLQ